MQKNLIIPESIGLRTEYKRKYSVREMYRAFILIPGAAAQMVRNMRKQLLDKGFVERLQLAVTEVNGCAACSYAHTYMALKQGMSSEEINSFLSGDGKFIHREEAKAILFAQHYADTRAFPKKDAYDAMIEEYGSQKVKVILSAIQLMQAANIYGLPFSALVSRLKGKPYQNSSILYELGMHIGGMVLFPIAMIDGALRMLLGLSNLKFDQQTTIEE